MGKGNKSSKSADKKREKAELEKKMSARLALVRAANEVEDPLENLPSFKRFNRNGVDVELRSERAVDLTADTKTWIMDLTTKNMKELYEHSQLGWNEPKKRKEMLDDRAWYLIARKHIEAIDGNEQTEELIGFAHFRFDMDYDDEVLYIYEIQLEDSVKRKGLGRFMMQLLELLSFKTDMRKIMLTCLRNDEPTQKFFKDTLKYGKDETCPKDTVYQQYDYEILSKPNRRKLAREEREKMQAEDESKVISNDFSKENKQIIPSIGA